MFKIVQFEVVEVRFNFSKFYFKDFDFNIYIFYYELIIQFLFLLFKEIDIINV